MAVGGCLAQRMKPAGWTKIRVCNSEDDSAASDHDYCRQPNEGLEHMEIRIFAQNWEAAAFETWVLQIILSELLDIPATVETGTATGRLNFYDPAAQFVFGRANDYDAIRRANEYEDCRRVVQQEPSAGDDDEQYESCAHVILEVWANGHLHAIQELEEAGVIEPTTSLGSLAGEGWFIPKFTAERDPSLMTYLGIRGEKNRRKLAETFLRPTTWGDYCDLVSVDNCTTADDVASRAPLDEMERDRMFVRDLYIGHFRATEANNCTLHPTNCSGHIADYPCGWSSYVETQVYHLGIALKAVRYSYTQLKDLWEAANATKSNFVAQWWTPESLHHIFLGTDAELQKVALKPPTQTCLDSRVDETLRCEKEKWADAVANSDPNGACDESPQVIQKMVSAGLHPTLNDESIPVSLRSPAYEAIQRFKMTDLQFGKFSEYWLRGSSDTLEGKADPREAACRWAVENFDLINSFAPVSHPRVLDHTGGSVPFFYCALSLASLAAAMTIGALILTWHQRKKRVMVYAQPIFLWLLLAGVVLVSAGGIMTAVPTSDATCIVAAWMLSHGYTLLLVPLIVKVAAINRLMHAARKCRRVTLKRKRLLGAVFVIDLSVTIVLVAWTFLDPPLNAFQYETTDTMNARNETVIKVNSYCASEGRGWLVGLLTWNFILILVAGILAFDMRKVPSAFRETQTLVLMIYSHFVFAALRALTTFLSTSSQSGLNETDIRRFQSVIYSLDVIATICIYFVPKFIAADNASSANPLGSFTALFLPRLRERVASRNRPTILRDNGESADNTPSTANNNRNSVKSSAPSEGSSQDEPSSTQCCNHCGRPCNHCAESFARRSLLGALLDDGEPAFDSQMMESNTSGGATVDIDSGATSDTATRIEDGKQEVNESEPE
eukprot:CAMPEP_0194051936 /NCGR_PEP_ID=MMETSP0009_2-20130614/43127_1 /TAXON_ID=210454 /ORGANISM="Grammatophora oceanica, Strain CCMP 410" /LENGTH=895 /DNA_ID=CAMNT_0038699265 /DNA_START=192 /DNA_END=2879 /DNA_ORIENTATION=+